MKYRSKLVGLLLVCVAGTVSASPAGIATKKNSGREVLPDNVVPLHYELSLSPDAEALAYRAKVAITIEVRTQTAAITLNEVGLSFDHTVVDGDKEGSVRIDEKLGRATITVDAPLTLGRHVLSIDYHGKIDRSTLGFFAMDYAGPDGPRRTLATNFEPAAARQLLPCWDEPARKATFTVSVTAPKDRMAISNMPVAEVTSLSENSQRVRFAQTPKMSTYLLFVAVGDFERVHSVVDGVDVGVVVKRGDMGKAAYALEQASQLLHYYNEYFGTPFPLPKLDLIAAPGQISGGSMENWGAIFYSQNHLLFDSATSTEEDRQTVFLVVSHEMAHQWFGDLVTMAWWSDLWLNEGFARWMQTFAADDLHPEWQTGLQAMSIFESGKSADSVPSTHPVVQEVDTADQAAQSFDEITYDKGAAIITMMNAYAGRDRFREGVRRYMHAHAFGNTVDTDLWHLIEQTAGKPIVAIEHDFTRQEGLPLVRVTGAATGSHAEQTRFADDPTSIAKLPPQHWRLPLAISRVGAEPRYQILQGSVTLDQKPPLLVNAGQAAYTRVLYDSASLSALTAQMGSLNSADQVGLMNDARALGVAGYTSAADLLNVAAALPRQANPIVWQRLIEIVREIDQHYLDTAARTAYRHFALGMLAPLAAEIGPLGTPGGDANMQILRSDLTEIRGSLGEAQVIEDARKRVNQGDGTPAEQRCALTIAAEQADSAGFDALIAKANRTADPLEKMHILHALARVKQPELARRMLDIALSDQAPAGSAPGLIIGLARTHADMVWQVLAPRLNDPSLPFEKTLRWDLASLTAGYSDDPKRIADLEAYEAANVPEEARKPFLSALASIRRNQRIRSKVLPQVDEWIATHTSTH